MHRGAAAQRGCSVRGHHPDAVREGQEGCRAASQHLGLGGAPHPQYSASASAWVLGDGHWSWTAPQCGGTSPPLKVVLPRNRQLSGFGGGIGPSRPTPPGRTFAHGGIQSAGAWMDLPDSNVIVSGASAVLQCGWRQCLLVSLWQPPCAGAATVSVAPAPPPPPARGSSQTRDCAQRTSTVAAVGDGRGPHAV